MSMHTAGQRISTPRVLLFSTVGLVLGYLLISVSVFLPPLLASHIGVSLTAIGSAWAIVRVVDIVVDPLLGIVMDRTSTRFGRYRAWLLIGAPILMAAIYALFEAHNGIGFSYLLGWLLIFYIGVSIVTVAHSSWAARLATDYDDRARMFGLIAMVSIVGGVVVLAFPLLANPLGWNSSQAVHAMGWFILVLIPLVIGLVCFQAEDPPRGGEEHVRLRDFRAVLTEPNLLRLLLAQLMLTLGPGWMSALYLFDLTQARGFTLGAASVLLLFYMVAGIFGALMAARAAVQFSKHRTLIATAIAFSLGLCLVAVVPKANLVATIPVMAWLGFMGAGFDMMVRAMLADVADQVQLEQGKDQLSLIYGLNSAANKLASALAIGLTFPLLSYLGFNPADGAHNTANAIHGLEWAFIMGPIVFVLLGAFSIMGWKLGPLRHAEIRRQLSSRDIPQGKVPA